MSADDPDYDAAISIPAALLDRQAARPLQEASEPHQPRHEQPSARRHSALGVLCHRSARALARPLKTTSMSVRRREIKAVVRRLIGRAASAPASRRGHAEGLSIAVGLYLHALTLRRTAVLVLLPSPAFAWGFAAHWLIMRRIDASARDQAVLRRTPGRPRDPRDRSRHVADDRLGRRSESLSEPRHAGVRRPAELHGAPARLHRRAAEARRSRSRTARQAAVARGRDVRRPSACVHRPRRREPV